MRKPPENWIDEEYNPNLARKHGGNYSKRDRARNIPEDSILETERYVKNLTMSGLWIDPKRTLRFLALCRIPTLALSEIGTMLNEEFSETRFTRGALSGRLDRLRAYSKGFYGTKLNKRFPRQGS